ncbi:hypothetical protein JHK87_016089 [Glycine soja]|nr:hypothetical protein JHK87_016089 [Glycine soja]
MKGFASLEAKMKFRAPWVSPTAINETKNSTASVIDSDNWGSVPPLNSHDSNEVSNWPTFREYTLEQLKNATSGFVVENIVSEHG